MQFLRQKIASNELFQKIDHKLSISFSRHLGKFKAKKAETPLPFERYPTLSVHNYNLWRLLAVTWFILWLLKVGSAYFQCLKISYSSNSLF